MTQNEPKPLDSVDALAAMAGGQDLDEKKPSEPPQDPPVQDGAALGAPGFPASGGAATGVAAPHARQSAMKQRLAYSMQYKQFVTPLMLTTGLILEIMGIFAFVFGGEHKVSDDPLQSAGFTLGKNAWIFAAVAIPVGLILLAGAWLFRAELKRKKA